MAGLIYSVSLLVRPRCFERKLCRIMLGCNTARLADKVMDANKPTRMTAFMWRTLLGQDGANWLVSHASRTGTVAGSPSGRPLQHFGDALVRELVPHCTNGVRDDA